MLLGETIAEHATLKGQWFEGEAWPCSSLGSIHHNRELLSWSQPRCPTSGAAVHHILAKVLRWAWFWGEAGKLEPSLGSSSAHSVNPMGMESEQEVGVGVVSAAVVLVLVAPETKS